MYHALMSFYRNTPIIDILYVVEPLKFRSVTKDFHSKDFFINEKHIRPNYFYYHTLLLACNFACFACTDKEISGGSIKVVAKYGIITILDQSYDVCDILKEINKDCPIPAGVSTRMHVCMVVYMCVSLCCVPSTFCLCFMGLCV